MGRDNLRPLAPPPRSRGRIDDVEVLRALAIGMVLVHHVLGVLLGAPPAAKSPYAPWAFWSGVDLFLVISGFVIGRSLLPTLPPASDHRAFFTAALSFWVRRAWRLLPSAWLWLIVPILAAKYFNRSGAFGPLDANLRGAAAAVLNLANFNFAYSFARLPTGTVFQYWSLSLEEQFYLALPLVVFLARGRLSTALVAIAASQFFIKRAGLYSDLLFTLIRSDGLCLGVLLAIWSQHADYRRNEPTFLTASLSRWLLPAAFVLVYGLVTGPAFGYPRVTVAVLAGLGAAIVWVASYDRDYLFPPGRFKQAVCWLGARSYAIYLIHVPIYVATREFWFRVRPEALQPGAHNAALLLATSLPLVGVLAELNFRLVEDPLRRCGARIAERMGGRPHPKVAGEVQSVG